MMGRYGAESTVARPGPFLVLCVIPVRMFSSLLPAGSEVVGAAVTRRQRP